MNIRDIWKDFSSFQKGDILDWAQKTGLFIERNFRSFLALALVLLVLSISYVTYERFRESRQREAFSKLFSLIQSHGPQKEDLVNKESSLGSSPSEGDLLEKSGNSQSFKNSDSVSKDSQSSKTKWASRLESFISEFSGSRASAEATLILSEVYEDLGQNQKAAEVLVGLLDSWSQRDFLFYIINMRAGDLLSLSGDCKRAVDFWDQVAQETNFMSLQAQVRMGICHEKMGHSQEARNLFSRVGFKDPNSVEGFNSKRYLLYLEFKNQHQKKIKEQAKKIQGRGRG